MINAKTVTGVVIIAVLIGVLYVVFEKNFAPEESLSQSETISTQELSREAPEQTSVTSLPTPDPTPPPITRSSDLATEASGLEMRDYSSYFEGLKAKINQ